MVLEDALRCLISHFGENWAKLLGHVGYAHTTSVNASIKLNPFEIDLEEKGIQSDVVDHDGLDSESIS